LRAGTTTWFPLEKVEKSLTSKADSPAAFARVAISMSGPAPAAREEDEPPDPKGVKLVNAFFEKPSAATLQGLGNARSHLYAKQLVALLRKHRAKPAMFYPFFTTPPAGRGYKQFDAGAAAARHAWLLIDEDVADFEEEVPAIAQLLEGKDKHARRNAAYVTGRMAFRRGHADDARRQYEHGDTAIREGTITAVRSVVGDAVMKYIAAPDPASLAPVLTVALRAASDTDRTLALESIHQIAVRLRADISSLLDPLIEVLERGKPAQVEYVLQTLASFAAQIKRGAAYDARLASTLATVIRHAKPSPGKKRTKVQIAAHSTLRAYRELGERFTAKHHAAIDKALG
jgi:hypothetical protein